MRAALAILAVGLAACGPKGGAPSTPPPSNTTEPADGADTPSDHGTIRTTVVDAATGEPLAGATLVIDDREPEVADTAGVLVVRVPGGEHGVTIYYADLTMRITDVPVSPQRETAVCARLDTNAAGGEGETVSYSAARCD